MSWIADLLVPPFEFLFAVGARLVFSVRFNYDSALCSWNCEPRPA